MIEKNQPETWKDLEVSVKNILLECGLMAESPKKIKTVRGDVEVDVYAIDNSLVPPIIHLCECKHWKRRVSQSTVHSFRTIINDYGANIGLIISLNGFQSGSYKAVENSTIKLLNWEEFQNLFIDKWYNEYFVKSLSEIVKPLSDYTETFNTKVFRKADTLSDEKKNKFKGLRNKYLPLVLFVLSLKSSVLPKRIQTLPLEKSDIIVQKEDWIPIEILDAQSLRELLEVLSTHIKRGIQDFDELFGKRV